MSAYDLAGHKYVENLHCIFGTNIAAVGSGTVIIQK